MFGLGRGMRNEERGERFLSHEWSGVDMNPLKMVGGVSIQQASELIGVSSGKVLTLISSGALENISYGAGGVDGVTAESVTNFIKQQAEKDLFQRKTIDRAHKSWDVFERFFLDVGGSEKFSKIYDVYEKWTKREGLMTLGKVELGDYLVGIRGLKEDWSEAEREIIGFTFKADVFSTSSDKFEKMFNHWFNSEITVDSDLSISASELYEHFGKFWSSKTKDRRPSQRVFGLILGKMNIEKDRCAGNGRRRYRGIGIKHGGING